MNGCEWETSFRHQRKNPISVEEKFRIFSHIPCHMTAPVIRKLKLLYCSLYGWVSLRKIQYWYLFTFHFNTGSWTIILRYQFYPIQFNKRLYYTYSLSALSLAVIWCFSCKTQGVQPIISTTTVDRGTKSMLHVYWLTIAHEINSFGQSIPNFDACHFSMFNSIDAVWPVP